MARSSGIVKGGLKIALWGGAGLYKSSFASKLDKPLFVDPNGGTAQLAVERESVDSWQDVSDLLSSVELGEEECMTLVLDEFTNIEAMLLEDFLKRNRKDSLADFGHGKGYFAFRAEFGNLIQRLNRIAYRGTNVVIITHSIEKTVTSPEGPDYEKYVPTLDKGNWGQVHRWSDATLFFGRRVGIAKMEDGKTFGSTGKERIFAKETALFDAKNRFNMPAFISNDYGATDKMMLFVEGTRLLGEGKLEKNGMNDDEVVKSYVKSKLEGK